MDAVLRNLPVFLVFLTVAAFAWIFGGIRPNALLPTMPWLYLFLFESLFFFPQRRPYEDAAAARYRVWHALARDPLFYVVIVFLVVLVLPLVNCGLCPTCDAAAIAAGANAAPPIPFAPFCVRVREHFDVLVWFLPSLTAMLAARHALLRTGKRLLVEMIVWNAALLAVLGFIQQGTGAEFPLWTKRPVIANMGQTPFFSTFGYMNMGGAFFVMAFAFAVGLWQHRVSQVAALPRMDSAKSMKKQRLHRLVQGHYPLIPLVLCFFGTLATLSRAALLLLFALTALAFAYHECALLLARRDRARNLKKAAFGVGGALLFAALAYAFAPANLAREFRSLDATEVADRVSGKAQYHTRVAFQVFMDHPLFGVGGWGYKHFCVGKLSEKELPKLQVYGGANVHNDFLQFLCEHGAVGVLALVAVFALLLVPLFRDWYKLYLASRFVTDDKAPPSPRAVFCLPAGALWIFLGNVALLIHACGDCPMRSPAVLSMFFVSLACLEGFLPREIEVSK